MCTNGNETDKANVNAMFGKAYSNTSRLGLAPIKGPCHSSIERGSESFSLNVLDEDFIVFRRVYNIKDLKRRMTAKSHTKYNRFLNYYQQKIVMI